MLPRPIAQVEASYPWPPISYPVSFGRLLGLMQADPDLSDPRHLAYVLATVRHETGFTYAPVEEVGKGAGKPYGRVYYGRGYVQLTWEDNYRRFGEALGVGLLGSPELALEPGVAWRVASMGMRLGMFTGKRLSDFELAGGGYDWFDARRIVNALDRAGLIAGYAQAFYASLTA